MSFYSPKSLEGKHSYGSYLSLICTRSSRVYGADYSICHFKATTTLIFMHSCVQFSDSPWRFPQRRAVSCTILSRISSLNGATWLAMAKILLELATAKLLEIAAVASRCSLVAHVEVGTHSIILLSMVSQVSLSQSIALTTWRLHCVGC